MNRHGIRLVVLLGAVSIAGLLLIQFFWIRQAYVTESRTFDHNVHLALRNVVESLCQYEGQDFPAYNAIEQVSGNYYIVRTSQVLQPGTLEYFLSAELGKRNILTAFEYGIYDCQSQHMVYGNQVNGQDQVKKVNFPSLKGDSYYFGVLFPARQRFLLGRIDFLMYMSSGLLLVIGFFAYSIVVMTRQKRLSEVQRDFINNMTHEFKTPLSTIRLSAEVIKNAGSADRLQTYASLIEKEAQRLQYHVDEVLQVALIEKSKLRLNLKTYPVLRLFDDFAERAEGKVKETGGKWTYEPCAADILIEADALHFQNVLNNLLDNSLKYAVPTPEVRLAASVSQHQVLIQFTDNGPGIPEKDQKNIFRKFYRVSTGDLHQVAGFGLGLFYVKQIVKAHKGQISVSSSPGNGTTFYIHLPISRS